MMYPNPNILGRVGRRTPDGKATPLGMAWMCAVGLAVASLLFFFYAWNTYWHKASKADAIMRSQKSRLMQFADRGNCLEVIKILDQSAVLVANDDMRAMLPGYDPTQLAAEFRDHLTTACEVLHVERDQPEPSEPQKQPDHQ